MGRPRQATLAFLLLTGCGFSPEGAPDATAPARDAGTTPPPADAAAPTDAGAVGPDATPADTGASSAPDAGEVEIDAGEVEVDAGAPPRGGCGGPRPDTSEPWSIPHDGRTRSALVHLPTGYDGARPTAIVLDLHGRAFTGASQRDLTDMDDLADEMGFIAVHPDGVGRTWNGGVCCGQASRDDIDDVGFIAALLDRLEAELCVDTRRVYATGLSNGGFLSHRLACELSDRIAAIAPVAGVLGVADCAPSRPVPVLHIHGDDDQVVRYDGVAGFLSARSSCERWAELDGCDPTPAVTFTQDDVTCETWTGCNAGAAVELCTIAGGGHTWPGGPDLPLLGRTSRTISASRRAWSFFSAHPKP